MTPLLSRPLCLALLLAASTVLSGQNLVVDYVEDVVLQERLSANPRKNEARMEALSSFFDAAGCTGANLNRQPIKNKKKPPNVICVLPGSGEGTVVVGAHFDYVNAGSGAVDNWSGASLLPSLYQALAKRPRTLTFIFAGFSEEEIGLDGSRHFVQQWRRENRPAPIAMVNLDCLGLSPTKISVTTSDQRLMNQAARIAQAMKLPLQGVNVDQVGISDAVSFGREKIPTLDVTSITQESLSYLHSPEDTSDKIKFEHYRDTFKLVSAFLTYMDVSHAARPAAQPQPSGPSQ